jgi:hypothetical protein
MANDFPSDGKLSVLFCLQCWEEDHVLRLQICGKWTLLLQRQMEKYACGSSDVKLLSELSKDINEIHGVQEVLSIRVTHQAKRHQSLGCPLMLYPNMFAIV